MKEWIHHQWFMCGTGQTFTQRITSMNTEWKMILGIRFAAFKWYIMRISLLIRNAVGTFKIAISFARLHHMKSKALWFRFAQFFFVCVCVCVLLMSLEFVKLLHVAWRHFTVHLWNSQCELWKWYYNMHYDRFSCWFSIYFFFHTILSLNKVSFFSHFSFNHEECVKLCFFTLFSFLWNRPSSSDGLQIIVSCNFNHSFWLHFLYSCTNRKSEIASCVQYIFFNG